MTDLRLVPGEGSDTPDYFVVGEAPGVEEEKRGRPFVGYSGDLMRTSFQRVGIDVRSTYITNVSPARPPGNKINLWAKPSKKLCRVPNEIVTAGLVQLYRDVALRKPKVIIPMGNVAMWAFLGHEKIARWRGSVLPATLDSHRIGIVSPYLSSSEMYSILSEVIKCKVLPTWHPAAVTRQYNLRPVFEKDLAKAKREIGYPEIRWPKREIYLDPDYATAHLLAERLLQAPYFGFDIETPGGKFWCISFASEPSWGFVLRTDTAWKMALIRMLLESDKAKGGSNALFDTSYTLYHNDIDVKNYCYDSQYVHKICYPEFKAGLDFQGSFYTDEPYYKDDGKDLDLSIAENEEQYMLYCGKDSCVHVEVKQQQEQIELRNKAHRASVDSHMRLLYICRRMMVRGMRVDIDKLIQLRKESQEKLLAAQTKIDNAILAQMTHMAEHDKDPFKKAEAYKLAVRMMKSLKSEEPGFNVFSNPDVKLYLYKLRGFKEKRHKTTKAVTAEETALKELYVETLDPTLLDIVKAREERKLQSTYLTPRVAPYGRIVYSVNPCGTKTLRWTSGQTIVILSPSKKKRRKAKSGTNAQTIPRIVRGAIVPDDGYVLFYADLRQVEDRIVAYAGGVKKKIHAFENGINAHSLSAAGYFTTTVEAVEQEKEEYKQKHQEPPMYYIGKQGNHAYNYGEGARTFKVNFNKKIDETGIKITEAQAKAIRVRHFQLYPEIEYGYWEWIKETLRTKRMRLTNPFGYERVLYGNPKDDRTNRDGYSWYPQSTAPEIINRAMIRIDKELPEVEMFIHMHDAIFGQVPEAQADVLKPAILELMVEPIQVRDHTITIPVDFKYGTNWGSL